MRIHFYGAAGEVTGSNFLIETENSKILLDCGLFQGKRIAPKQNHLPFAYEPKSIDAVILTHAHLDHCGRIPKLYKDGFRGPIYATPPTRDLAELIMVDASEIMLHEAEDENDEPLYLAVDVAGAVAQFKTIEYRTPIKVSVDTSVEFFDAGHILGSASIAVTSGDKTAVFSGDIGNHPVPILNEPQSPTSANLVVMEATYGGRLHESSKDRRVKLRSIIRQTAQKNGVLLIPAFALERTQELLYELGQLIEEASIQPLPVFLDSPLASAATEVYYKYPEYYDPDARSLLNNGAHLFSFPTLKITESVEQSKAIKEIKGPKIIIAGSGMMEGGRIQYHLQDYLSNPSTTLLIVGYQAEGTLGRDIYNGKRTVKIGKRMVSIKGRVVAIGAYSAHADQAGLKSWLKAIGKQPERVYLVHAEADSARAFTQELGSDYVVTSPHLADEVEL